MDNFVALPRRISSEAPDWTSMAVEMWSFRHLFLIFVWRTLKVRYKQTTIGVAWAVLQPLTMTFIFTVIFGRLAGMPTNGVPYPLFVVSGLIVWQLVAQSFQNATGSIVANAGLVTRIYFPRIFLPLAAITAALFDFLCAFALLIVLMIWYGISPTIGMLVFIPVIALAMVTVLGLSLWLGTLYVPYRDVGHLLPFLTQIWMFVSPVIYPSSLLPPHYQFLYSLNPIVVVIDTSRWAFCGASPPSVGGGLVSTIVAVCLFGSGLWFFRRHERNFADVV
jgi:lipopolysaccharide transport system permease protein